MTERNQIIADYLKKVGEHLVKNAEDIVEGDLDIYSLSIQISVKENPFSDTKNDIVATMETTTHSSSVL